MVEDSIKAVIRHFLTSLGGGLVAQGYLMGDDLNAAVGAVITLAGIGWSILHKYKINK